MNPDFPGEGALASLRSDKLSDAAVRSLIRSKLPKHVFLPRPIRLLWIIPLIGLILGASIAQIALHLPLVFAILIALVVGHTWASLMLFAHEIAHGATVRSRRIQDAVLMFACLIFCVSPHLWRVWHHLQHHTHTNERARDPDTFGTREQHTGVLSKLLMRFFPGSRHWFSWLYLPLFFTVHAQGVLWVKSRTWKQSTFSRHRAVFESMAMATFWLILSWCIGFRLLFVIVIPMLVANSLIMSYITTNHLMMPLSGPRDILATTMSVSTNKWLDRLHFYFSHHVEHHLFPCMPSRNYPLVRVILLRYFPDRYLAPNHWHALKVLFSTPRIYDLDGNLVNPLNGDSVRLVDIENKLRGLTLDPPTARA